LRALRVVSLAGGKPAFERVGLVAGQSITDHRWIPAGLRVSAQMRSADSGGWIRYTQRLLSPPRKRGSESSDPTRGLRERLHVSAITQPCLVLGSKRAI